MKVICLFAVGICAVLVQGVRAAGPARPARQPGFARPAQPARSPSAEMAQSTSPNNPYEIPAAAGGGTEVDQIVFSHLKRLGTEPVELCSDAVFVRRIYLDLIGTLPTGFEAQEFLLDRNPDKRKSLISKLLKDERFAGYWAMKWSDLLRIKAEFPINLWPNAVQAYHRWIRTSIRDGMPYDQFARELLTSSGSNFRVPEANFYRAAQSREPAGLAQAVALTFMGVRAEKWPGEKLNGMAAFFSQIQYKNTGEWKEEIVVFNPALATNKLWLRAEFPDGVKAQLTPGEDPRVAFAKWLVNPQNPWFSRNIANRAWSWMLGRGIIHEPDDIRPENPPANPELLEYLERELIRSGYDLRRLFQLIAESRVYQLSSIAKSTNMLAEANFASYPIRRLEAEVLMDALNQITGTSEKYVSAIPEPATVIPASERAIDLADGSITSSFLELFGRPSRDTGYESERNNKPTAAQRLHLLNSTHIQQKIENSRMIHYQTSGGKSPQEIATGIYLGILSRFPTRNELESVEEYWANTTAKQAAVDLAWALINTSEFVCRH